MADLRGRVGPCTLAIVVLVSVTHLATSTATCAQGQDFSEIIKRCQDSVVLIEVRDASEKLVKTGSGFIVSADGRVITNYHVIKGAHSAFVKLTNGAFFRTEGLIASDEDADIAVLKVNGNNLPALALANSDKAAVAANR